jgi:putative hydrolases of HD superfamily
MNEEYEKKASPEAILAHDADTLELIFFLKEQYDLGNPRAWEWLINAEKRLITKEAKILAAEMKDRKADDWWKMRTAKPRELKPD